MPYVHLRIAGALSRDQKAEIAEAFTEALERIAAKPRSYTYVTIEEIAEENWAVAGRLLDES